MKKTQKLCELAKLRNFVAADACIGCTINAFWKRRRYVGRSTYGTAGAIVQRCATDGATQFKNLATLCTANTAGGRCNMTRRTIEQPTIDNIRHIAGAIAVRTITVNNDAGNRFHPVQRRLKRFFLFLFNEWNTQFFREFLNNLVGKLRGHSCFKHRKSRLCTADFP